ncbi:MAG: hypothetical protein KDC38_18020, partial [Planctomycetes bacterium]|nr:hypothetical protein [Planctomycetota bacterium]
MMPLYTEKDYLRPGAASPWRWSEDFSEIIAHSPGDAPPHERDAAHGALIVFREELARLLRVFEGDGLPDLDSILAVLAVARHPTLARERRALDDDARALLEAVSALPEDLRGDLEANQRLLATIFESAPRTTDAMETLMVIRALLSGVHFAGTASSRRPSKSAATTRLPRGDVALTAASADIDPRSLEERLRSGVPHTPGSAPIAALPELLRGFIGSLLGDPELTRFARLVEGILAASSVPRLRRPTEDLPVGGVSDLSNRGPIERILSSELAHDADTFAIRVALDEALYLRRESPPRDPPTTRRIIIDSGLRTWGVPRVFATAVGLALAAEGSSDTEITIYRGGRTATPIELHHREGLLQQLRASDASLDCAGALAALAETTVERDEESESVVVVHESATEQPELIAALRLLPTPLYVATVHESGRYRLWRYGSRGRTPIAEAQFSLADVIDADPEQPATPDLLEERRLVRGPKLLDLARLPFSIDVDLRDAVTLLTERGLIAVTPVGGLVHVPQPGGRANELSHAIPTGRVLWLGRRHDEMRIVVAESHLEVTAIVVDGARGETRLSRHAIPGARNEIVERAEFRLGGHLAV